MSTKKQNTLSSHCPARDVSAPHCGTDFFERERESQRASERERETERDTERDTERERDLETERERREREFLSTITKWLKAGKYNALSGDIAPGRTGSSIDGEYSTPTLRLAVLSSALRGT